MFHKLLVLRDEIEEELANINELQNNLGLIKEKNLEQEIKKRVYASILSDFYMAVERIFKLVAKGIDGDLIEGEEWHKTLLRQMSVELPEIRPPVINKKLFHLLEEYLKFRHLVRNIYGFQLEYKRFSHLVEQLDIVVSELEQQVTTFLNKMQEIAENL